MKVTELKDRLRSLGMKVGGNKAELIDRLLLHNSNPIDDDKNGSIVAAVVDPQAAQAAVLYPTVPKDGVVILACKS